MPGVGYSPRGARREGDLPRMHTDGHGRAPPGRANLFRPCNRLRTRHLRLLIVPGTLTLTALTDPPFLPSSLTAFLSGLIQEHLRNAGTEECRKEMQERNGGAEFVSASSVPGFLAFCLPKRCLALARSAGMSSVGPVSPRVPHGAPTAPAVGGPDDRMADAGTGACPVPGHGVWHNPTWQRRRAMRANGAKIRRAQ